MLKISATQLETYRRYMLDKISLQQLIDSWTKQTEPSIKMKTGSIFHAKIQGMEYEEDAMINIDDNDIKHAMTKVDSRSKIFEYKLRTPINTAYGAVMFTGVADHIVGNVVHEFKTTFSAFNYDQYAESMQWRAYCYLFGVEKVKYHVWTLSEPKDNGDIIRVKDYNSMTMYANSCTQHEFLATLDKAIGLIHALKLQDAEKLQYA